MHAKRVVASGGHGDVVAWLSIRKILVISLRRKMS